MTSLVPGVWCSPGYRDGKWTVGCQELGSERVGNCCFSGAEFLGIDGPGVTQQWAYTHCQFTKQFKMLSIVFVCVCVCIFYLDGCVCTTHVPGARGGQKRGLDILEIEPRSPEELLVLLTAEPSLQLLH